MITKIGNESKDALLCDIFPHIILLGFCDWKWVLLVHGISWWFGEADDSTGLFLRSDYCNAVLAGTISGSPTHCGMYCSGSQATWPHDSSCARVTLVTSRREDPVQVVLAGTQVAFRTYVREYILDLLTSVANVPAWSAPHALSSGSLVVPQTHLRISDRAFSVAAPWAWNRLPTQLKLLLQSTTTRRRGVVVSGVRRMNEVNARRARFVPGWVTVFGRVYHLGM